MVVVVGFDVLFVVFAVGVSVDDVVLVGTCVLLLLLLGVVCDGVFADEVSAERNITTFSSLVLVEV